MTSIASSSRLPHSAAGIPPASDHAAVPSVVRMLQSHVSVGTVHALVIKTPPLRTQLAYNAIIQALVDTDHRSSPLEAILVYREMIAGGLLPDDYTLPYVLKACACAIALKEGEQIHVHAIKTGRSVSNVYVNNTLMRLYAVCGELGAARRLFDRCPQWRRDLIAWTTLIQGYVKSGFPREGLRLFFAMCEDGPVADEMTLAIVLSACGRLGDLSLGKRIYRYMLDKELRRDVFVGNALVDMFLKCRGLKFAYRMFGQMQVKNVVSWNAMILGLARQGKFGDALKVFKNMQSAGVEPDDVTIVGVLNSCANLGLLESGKWVHAYLRKNKIWPDSFIGNALVDMYAKCGSIDRALSVFEGMTTRDVYSYTAIIVGLAMHGEAARALEIFDEMVIAGVNPDKVTFLGVLSACSHAGLTQEGLQLFQEMSAVYGVEPQTEHYGCAVDLLGRAGMFAEAEALIKAMPMEPDYLVWGALLGACRVHGKVKLGEFAMKNLLKVDPDRDGSAHVLMSNIYSSAHRWQDALGTRKSMKQRDVEKIPGCSSIEVDGQVHEFRKGDKSHPKRSEISRLLDQFMSHSRSH
ncbi:hypothetical protein MLD38_039192 [Melastoma candidum]|uniref:Uncharacterized protein n=1 Tax=Melastoma candidum TaxID=119954 RepID=A0ACB9L3N5_9MYRT|nr:hypothetical protein MLD38_039192 [Melastoma candidum]